MFSHVLPRVCKPTILVHDLVCPRSSIHPTLRALGIRHPNFLLIQGSVEALEITLSGPELRFVKPAIVALTGAAMEAHLDGETFPMWTRVHVKAGQRLKIGKTTGAGCRAYLAVYGGFSNVAKYFGSKSTSPLVGIGGYQGRQLAPGDLLTVTENIPESLSKTVALPCLLYTSPSPRDGLLSRMPSSA